MTLAKRQRISYDEVEAVENEEDSNPQTVILSSVFQFLTWSDLANCRLVNREWNEEATKICNHSLTVVLSSNVIKQFFIDDTPSNYISTFFKYYEQRPIMGISLHLQNMIRERLHGFPPHSAIRRPFDPHFKLEYLYQNEFNHWYLRHFWEVCGSSITKLELSHFVVPSVKCFYQTLFVLLPKLKDLMIKRVVLTNSNDNELGLFKNVVKISGVNVQPQPNLKYLEVYWANTEVLPFDWRIFFNYFPGMQRLKLVVEHESQLYPMFHELSTISKKGESQLKLRHLQIFKLQGETNNVAQINSDQPTGLRFQQIFQRCRLPIEALDVNSAVLCNWSLSNLLTTCKSTLKFLWIRHIADLNWLDFELPNLEQLVFDYIKLEFRNTMTNRDRGYSCIDFLRFTPKLVSLGLGFSMDGDKPVAIKAVCSKPSLLRTLPKNLRILRLREVAGSGTGGSVDCSYLAQSYWRFPAFEKQITVLETALNNNAFRLICKYCKELKKLTVSHFLWKQFSFDDIGITSVVHLQRKRGNVCLDTDIFYSWPNITSLKKLHTFRMNIRNNLTERSIIYGFAKVDNLQRIELVVEKTQFSKEALKQLNSSVSNVVLRQI